MALITALSSCLKSFQFALTISLCNKRKYLSIYIYICIIPSVGHRLSAPQWRSWSPTRHVAQVSASIQQKPEFSSQYFPCGAEKGPAPRSHLLGPLKAIVPLQRCSGRTSIHPIPPWRCSPALTPKRQRKMSIAQVKEQSVKPEA